MTGPGSFGHGRIAASDRPGRRLRRRLYGLPARRQTGYVSAVTSAIQAPIPVEFPPRKAEPQMDSFELNKILGALLFSCLCLLGLNIGAEAMFHPAKLEKPGYRVEVREHAGGGEQARAEPDEPIEKLLASASADKGANSAKKCATCHTFGKGEPDRVGPNLYGVVGRPKGTEGGFAYSAGLKA